LFDRNDLSYALISQSVWERPIKTALGNYLIGRSVPGDSGKTDPKHKNHRTSMLIEQITTDAFRDRAHASPQSSMIIGLYPRFPASEYLRWIHSSVFWTTLSYDAYSAFPARDLAFHHRTG
jgi:hypothetical protein